MRQAREGAYPFLLPRSQRSAPKLCRPASIQLPEGTGKIAGILEAALGGDSGYLQGGAAQQLGGALQALAEQYGVQAALIEQK